MEHNILQEAAQAMQRAASSGRSVVRVLKQRCPRIQQQLLLDRKHAQLFSFWGRCLNFDENAGQTIVDPAILGAIGELAGVPMRGRVVHAGLQHTYGYLFSLIQTPYGLKRDRWISNIWETGFGLNRTLLGPRPDAGTLLANVTWFTGRIAFRGLPGPMRRLQRIAAIVAPELAEFDFDRLKVRRIEECTVPSTAGRSIRIVTDLVPFTCPTPADLEKAVLVYSIQNGSRAASKIITAFPVAKSMVDELEASVTPRTQIRLRYNAYYPGFAGSSIPGSRQITMT